MTISNSSALCWAARARARAASRYHLEQLKLYVYHVFASLKRSSAVTGCGTRASRRYTTGNVVRAFGGGPRFFHSSPVSGGDLSRTNNTLVVIRPNGANHHRQSCEDSSVRFLRLRTTTRANRYRICDANIFARVSEAGFSPVSLLSVCRGIAEREEVKTGRPSFMWPAMTRSNISSRFRRSFSLRRNSAIIPNGGRNNSAGVIEFFAASKRIGDGRRFGCSNKIAARWSLARSIVL